MNKKHGTENIQNTTKKSKQLNIQNSFGCLVVNIGGARPPCPIGIDATVQNI